MGRGVDKIFSLGVSTRALIDYALFLENRTGEMDAIRIESTKSSLGETQ